MNFRIQFDTVLYKFSRQEHQIDVLYVSFNAWDSQVSSYTPSHDFSFTVPLTLSFTFWDTDDLHISLKIWDPLHLEYWASVDIDQHFF